MRRVLEESLKLDDAGVLQPPVDGNLRLQLLLGPGLAKGRLVDNLEGHPAVFVIGNRSYEALSEPTLQSKIATPIITGSR